MTATQVTSLETPAAPEKKGHEEEIKNALGFLLPGVNDSLRGALAATIARLFEGSKTTDPEDLALAVPEAVPKSGLKKARLKSGPIENSGRLPPDLQATIDAQKIWANSLSSEERSDVSKLSGFSAMVLKRIDPETKEKSSMTYCAATSRLTATHVFQCANVPNGNAFEVMHLYEKRQSECALVRGTRPEMTHQLAEAGYLIADCFATSGSSFGHRFTAACDPKTGLWYAFDPYVRRPDPDHPGQKIQDNKAFPLDDYPRKILCMVGMTKDGPWKKPPVG